MYEYIESPNKSSRNGNQVEGIIVHFTAGGSLNSTIRYMCNQIIDPTTNKPFDAKVSAHYITGRDGTTIMLVPENMAAWHAGSSTTKPTLNGKGSLNLWTIGHEICNWGGLLERDGKFYCWPGNWTKEYKGPTPIRVLKSFPVAKTDPSYRVHGDENGALLFPDGLIEYWEPYTDEQIKATKKLWKDLVQRYNITAKWISGHEHVDPSRKIDPGPAFPWDDILKEVFIETDKTTLLDPIDGESLYELNLGNKTSDRKTNSSKCVAILRSLLQ